MGKVWYIMMPLLFVLIGAEVGLESIRLERIGHDLAVLSIGLILRTLTAFVVTYGLGLNIREMLFIAIAWLPKATVQVRINM